MNRRISYILVAFVLLFMTSCDADLFKTKDESREPDVSEMASSAINFTLNVGDTARFWITATDPDGKDLTYRWEKTDGYFLSTSDQPEVSWRAPFEGGDYSLTVIVSNGEKQTERNRMVRVISSEKPVVSILKPSQNEYLVQYQAYKVLVEAFHDNGISVVKFYVNDVFKTNMSTDTPNIYSYDWMVEDSAGLARIKVVAEARSVGTANEDYKQVQIEGVIPGKK